ncbi:MAG: diaminopimelate epimerase [Clostridia bacterium]|nr:diaminopimelate epimerase [Clostridia bacterium]MCR4885770.1 diaminopimelate epimerase [Clostridiales bacterium]
MKFTKMHGIGNDYIYVNCFEEVVSDPERLAIVMSKPHFGCGSDGLILIEPSDTADFGMRIFNSDGSEAGMCGNGIRCVGKYVYERGLTDKTELTIDTKGGLKQIKLQLEDGKVSRVKVDMGTPELNPRLIPVDLPGEMVLRHRLQIMGQTWFITCVNMGNPHAVLFVRDPEVVDLPTIGPMIEHHPLFPRRTNVEFVRVIDRGILQMRVWERGAGETLACGTGACAALVAAVLAGNSDRTVQMKLSGGNLQLHWSAEDNHVYQTGPAEFVYDGEWLGD